MDWRELLHRFDLHDHLSVDKEINSQDTVERNAIEFEADGLLRFDCQTQPQQVAAKDDLVDRFEQSWSQSVVELVGGVDDLGRYLVDVSCHRT